MVLIRLSWIRDDISRPFLPTRCFSCSRFLEIPRMLSCCLGFPRGQWVHFFGGEVILGPLL